MRSPVRYIGWHACEQILVGHDGQRTSHLTSSPFTEDELKKYCKYKMNHAKRGIALIFNHERFKKNTQRRRRGAAEDGRVLSSTVENLGFEVRLHKNKKWSKMKKIISRVAKEDHSDHDCLLVAIMTHGKKNGILYARDCPYDAEEVWNSFTAEKVTTLAGKPKIFLFQACRGKKLEESTIIKSFSRDSVEGRFIIPYNVDFLMRVLSGYYSWRNKIEGSWFIQDLCKDLNEYARTEEMLSILTNTLRRVAYTRCSNVPTDPDKDGRQEMPVFSSTLTKLLYFYETSH
ncbi:hypothetical protein J437_LFUL001291 [Ladona fulva]|uniref:Caspase-3 n=1 Tax=Ladona fulva TaxID=123851 RepID=A0A8K0NWF1_LADFU|nr:hypothetical protein J437_LFUL001291 [Ladona fulva]